MDSQKDGSVMDWKELGNGSADHCGRGINASSIRKIINNECSVIEEFVCENTGETAALLRAIIGNQSTTDVRWVDGNHDIDEDIPTAPELSAALLGNTLLIRLRAIGVF